MISFRLRGTTSQHERVMGPCAPCRIEGPLLIGADGQPWAKHHGGFWHSEDETYTMLWTDSPCRVHFETADKRSADFGPFELIQISDGVIRAGKPSPVAIARLIDSMGAWALTSDSTFWQTVVFSLPGPA